MDNFPSHVQKICLWNIYSIYINTCTYKPSTCWPSHTICPRYSTLMYGHTLFFWTRNNNGSCSLQTHTQQGSWHRYLVRCHLEDMPGTCHGSYRKLSPSPHGYGWIAHRSDIAILGMSNHVHPVKCWILWSFSASLLLCISLRDVVYEDMVVHAWCTCGPLSIVLYLSLLSDYKLVHWRSVFEF